MKSTCIKIARALLFLVVLAMLHVYLRSFCLRIDQGCAEAIAVVQAYLDLPTPPDVLFAGNSHVWVGVDVKSMPKTHSVAYLGESYITTYYKLKTLIERRGPPAKAIVLQLDLHSFAPSPLETEQNPYSALYVDHLELARSYDHVKDTFYAWLKWDVFPYAGQGSSVPGNLMLDEAQIRQEGSERHSRRFSDVARKESQAVQVAEGQLPSYAPWKHDADIDYFNRIARLCREHGLTLVWVRFPASEEYYAQMLQRLPIAEWQALVDSLLKQNSNVVLLDYHDIYFGHDDLFFDPNHLNDDGSIAFTKILREQLVRRALLSE